MKLTPTAQKAYIEGAHFAVNHANLVNEKLRTAQKVGVHQPAFSAQKGRSTRTRNTIRISAEDAYSVMEGMVCVYDAI